MLQRKLKLKNSFGYRLLSESLRSNFTPLKFNKQTKVMVVSAQEKQRQSEGLEALKQMHYRKSAQLADSLLYMFPQLISLLVERQLTNKKYPSKAELKGMIHSIY